MLSLDGARLFSSSLSSFFFFFVQIFVYCRLRARPLPASVEREEGQHAVARGAGCDVGAEPWSVSGHDHVVRCVFACLRAARWSAFKYDWAIIFPSSFC